MKLASPLHVFILASVGIHTGVFLIPGSADIALPGDSGSSMSVKLKEQHLQKIHPVTENKPVNKNHSTQPVLTKKTVNKIATNKIDTPQQTTAAHQENTVSKARVISLIYNELNNHFTYPKIAQRRNWQGQVLLAFRLNNDGTIEDIKVNHSSGYNVLDQAAVVSLKKIGQLPNASSWLINAMEIQIPIIYQLTQG